jgi:hypothetical protein
MEYNKKTNTQETLKLDTNPSYEEMLLHQMRIKKENSNPKRKKSSQIN